MPRSGALATSESPSLLFREDKYIDESATSTPRGESPGRDPFGAHGTSHIKTVHQFVASSAFLEEAGGFVSYETFNKVCGRGFAPWEVHRPQQAVRELLTAGCFKGAVLDCGCGIGDNSLFIAKYTSCAVDAVDFLPKCIAFAEMKAGLRNMRNRVGWHTFDLLLWDASPLAGRTYDCVLDSGLLHCMGPSGQGQGAAAARQQSRAAYLALLNRLLRPGGTLYCLALSDQERHPGGPGRLSRGELEALLSPEAGWSLQYVKPHVMEMHPTFWGGKAQAYLAAAQRS